MRGRRKAALRQRPGSRPQPLRLHYFQAAAVSRILAVLKVSLYTPTAAPCVKCILPEKNDAKVMR